MDTLVIDEAGEAREIEAKVVERPEELKALLNNDAWRIYEKLREKPSFPAELAKELLMNEQKVYYCVKQLRNSGLIEIEKTEERNGALAKYYSAPYGSFAIASKSAAQKTRVYRKSNEKAGEEGLLSEFTKRGVFSAKIVVGSPDPHGKYRGRARDGHLAAELTAFLASNTASFETPLVFLDTMVKDLSKENSNLIILGGPVSNKLAEQANKFLPVKFDSENGNWTLKSAETGKEYVEDSIGTIQKIPHPYFKGKWVMLIAGKRNTGTISAILALSKKTKETSSKEKGKKGEFARVVEGFDLDGDGMIDEVEFRE